MIDRNDEGRLSRELGMRLQPGLAGAYPELAQKLDAIYRDKVAKLPWLPPGWLDQVEAIHGTGGDILLPAPVFGKGGRINRDVAAWLDTPDRRQAWDDLATVATNARQQFVEDRRREGLVILAEAEANAAFWDAAYRLQAAVRQAARAVVDTATGLFKWGPTLLGLGAVGIAVYFLLRRKKGR